MPRAVVLLLSILLGCCQAAQAAGGAPIFFDTKERLQKPDLGTLPRLRFLTTTDFPPFNFLDGNGRLSGFHVELARAICAELGLADKCQIQALPWGELDKALADGEGEAIVAGMGISAETREKYGFSRPYLQFPARFVMQRGKALPEPLGDALKGKRIGVVAASAHERMLRGYFPSTTVNSFPDQEAMLADLKSGRIDGVFGDGMRLVFWLAGPDAANCCRFVGGPYLAPEYLGGGLAIATRPGDTTLVQAFDYALQQIVVKDIFSDLYLRYFPASFF